MHKALWTKFQIKKKKVYHALLAVVVVGRQYCKLIHQISSIIRRYALNPATVKNQAVTTPSLVEVRQTVIAKQRLEPLRSLLRSGLSILARRTQMSVMKKRKSPKKKP